MTYSELPIGADFSFGKNPIVRLNYATRSNEYIDEPIIWKKTGENNLAVCLNRNFSAPFDYKRTATGSNRYEREHGMRIYFLSALHKYLNCADNSWSTTAEGDANLDDERSGFLSHFSDSELCYITPHKIKINIPDGYTKKYGTTMEREMLVGIPSEEQIGYSGNLGTFQINTNAIPATWVTNATTMSRARRYGSYTKYQSDRTFFVAPVIKIKDDAPIDEAEDGRYIIRIPEADFTGDIDLFLGFDIAA